MKDDRGIYYRPSLQSPGTRMYVCEVDGIIMFRLHSEENPEIWERHGWLSMDAVRQAAQMYKDQGRDRNPLGLYDLDVAKRLLRDES